MKKRMLTLFIVVLCLCLAGTALANSAAEYKQKLEAGSPWSRYDYNVTYQKNARDYLPDYISGRKSTIRAEDCMVFGDETGEVWCIIDQKEYRMWFSAEGNLVLTSTSEGFGWTGYGVYTPSSGSL